MEPRDIRLKLANATIYDTAFVAAGTNLTFPDDHSTCTTKYQVVRTDICRVSLLVITGSASNVTLEAWLPFDWSGRFLTVGNGGLSGCIKHEDLNYGSSQGFATIGSNNGHNGTSGSPFYKNQGVLEDYAYRSVHLAAVLGKKISQKFYGEEHTKSYYLGCSTGGRQGFKEAQDFPADFDGIVAGAPAFDFNALMYWTGQFYLSTGDAGSATFLSATEWDLVYEDILRQCDDLDGLVDGIIEDPDLCQYRPEALICNATQTDSCLTGKQAATVRAVFSPTYGPDGTLVFPRLQPGANSTERFLSGEPQAYPVDWFRYVINEDPKWDPATLSPDDWTTVSEVNTFGMETWKGDLSEVKKQGTKILHYHGLQDNAITSENSARYYNHVSRTMGLRSDELDEFYRYFRISGLAHCSGGSGANFIGGNLATLAKYDPDENVLAAIVRWVERDVAPDFIMGTKFDDGTNSGEVVLQRKHCKYPSRNVYIGEGYYNSADSWDCV
ncbi:hypothetical protein G7Z17_g12903 [Cylindrodendrum hubeiense]|uniref:Carboxylic ester hydrolase n=1 Tax=Cylindrodendrum hubeiense TaxID=595255 RepID=A0A9P5H234_9HYPO|nr:hypothetical protein G7Z17_g12903 [Cylindrodendrum hubeiense]